MTTQPTLTDLLYNEERIIALQRLVSDLDIKIRRVPQGDFRYRGLWLQRHHYEQELNERHKFAQEYVKMVSREEGVDMMAREEYLNKLERDEYDGGKGE